MTIRLSDLMGMPHCLPARGLTRARKVHRPRSSLLLTSRPRRRTNAPFVQAGRRLRRCMARVRGVRRCGIVGQDDVWRSGLMLRGEIRLVDFGQSLSGESAHRSPAVIVSNDGANSTAARLGRGVVTVAPMTSNVSRIHPFQVLVPAHEMGSTMIPRFRQSRSGQSRSRE
jgi:mRNA-degrading endonuclease toxin of MazEF toxin-antitoxin module